MFLGIFVQTRPEKVEDPALLKAIAGGSSSALSELYDRYGKLVYSLAFHVVAEAGAAEEITQEVFFQIWNKAGTYQADQGKVVSWLASIARHRAIDTLRRRNARPEGHRLEWAEDEEPDLVDPAGVEEQVDLALRSAAVRQAISQLPNEQRSTLALAYFQGMTHQEIAETTGEPLGTIKTRIRLGMLKLRQLLEGPD
jgi:RNA polymerase sigma-70 factor (ECF subfamily)